MGNLNQKEEFPIESVGGRIPTDYELLMLMQWQRKLFTRLVESPEHIGLLKRYWSAFKPDDSFERTSPIWTLIGFREENPGPQLRSGGLLALECLVWFAENYTGEAKMMMRRNGYPWVKTGIAVVRALCEILHVIEVDGSKGGFPCVPTMYWQILQDELSFYRLFVFSFIMLDEIYCDTVAQRHWMQHDWDQTSLAELVNAGKDKLLRALELAPKSLSDLEALSINGRVISKETVNNSVVFSEKYPISRSFRSTSYRGSDRLKRSVWGDNKDLFAGLTQKSTSYSNNNQDEHA